MSFYNGLPGIQEQDRDQGVFWLEKAAENGSPDARAVVARAVFWNPSSEKEFREKVLGWLRAGRDQGDSDSVLILSEAFAAGLVPGRICMRSTIWACFMRTASGMETTNE